MAARCSTRLRGPTERLLRPGRPLSPPVGVLGGPGRLRRHRQSRPAREGGRRSSERPRPARGGVAGRIRSAGEDDAVRPRFHVHVHVVRVAAARHGARQARKAESAQDHRVGTNESVYCADRTV